jgi:hypothetical protein
MSAPAKPLDLDPDTAYIHITSSQPASSLSQTFASQSSAYRLHYVGPVGELKGEHVFEVRQAKGLHAVKRDSETWTHSQQDIIGAAKAVDGVSGVKVLETKQRVKRSEF